MSRHFMKFKNSPSSYLSKGHLKKNNQIDNKKIIQIANRSLSLRTMCQYCSYKVANYDQVGFQLRITTHV